MPAYPSKRKLRSNRKETYCSILHTLNVLTMLHKWSNLRTKVYRAFGHWTQEKVDLMADLQAPEHVGSFLHHVESCIAVHGLSSCGVWALEHVALQPMGLAVVVHVGPASPQHVGSQLAGP